MSEHPFRAIPPGRALQRAQVIMYAPLVAAMVVMLFAGYRLGLSIYRLSDAYVDGNAQRDRFGTFRHLPVKLPA